MAKCTKCESPFSTISRAVVDEYHDELLGAPFTVIIEDAVVRETCRVCGEEVGTAMPPLESLISAIAVARALHPWKLNGEEIRFLRKAVGWKAIQMAAQLDVNKSTMSKWENGKDKMGNGAERHLRLAVCTKLGKYAPLMEFDPEDVLGLEIQELRPVNFSMRCKRVPVSGQKTSGECKWSIAA